MDGPTFVSTTPSGEEKLRIPILDNMDEPSPKRPRRDLKKAISIGSSSFGEPANDEGDDACIAMVPPANDESDEALVSAVVRPPLNAKKKGKKARKSPIDKSLKDKAVADLSLPDGWTFSYRARKSGVRKGELDRYIVSPEGKIFRSLREAGL